MAGQSPGHSRQFSLVNTASYSFSLSDEMCIFIVGPRADEVTNNDEMNPSLFAG